MVNLGDLCLAVHLIGTIITVGAVAVTDALTFVTRVRPKTIKIIVFLSPFFSLLVWGGFFLLAVSGIVFLLLGRGNVGDPMFQLKMLFVAVVFVNGIVLSRWIEPQSETYVERGIYDLPESFERRAMASATISVIGWWGATFTAYFLVGGPP